MRTATSPASIASPSLASQASFRRRQGVRGSIQGFLLSGGVYTTIDFPGAILTLTFALTSSASRILVVSSVPSFRYISILLQPLQFLPHFNLAMPGVL